MAEGTADGRGQAGGEGNTRDMEKVQPATVAEDGEEEPDAGYKSEEKSRRDVWDGDKPSSKVQSKDLSVNPS